MNKMYEHERSLCYSSLAYFLNQVKTYSFRYVYPFEMTGLALRNYQ